MAFIRLCLGLIFLPVLAFAAGGPLNTLVVVNSQSRDSKKLGAYYMEKRGIPKRNLLSLPLTSKGPAISLADFETKIQKPIQDYLLSTKLAGQIDYLVLCMDIPSRVNNNNGITSALYYGYKPVLGNPRCQVSTNSINQYYATERAYHAATGWNASNTPLVFMLTAEDLETAKAVVDRGVAADASFPEGAVYYHGSGDQARNVRHPQYPKMGTLFSLFPEYPPAVIHTQSAPLPEQPIAGLTAGYAYIPGNLQTNEAVRFAPGAIAEHLTSCGGQFPDPCYGQANVLDWMRLGATASYGTVSEPCNFSVKFPDPMLHFWVARGFTVGEALYMSVRNPYQGLCVGDPLAAPFAAAPTIQILSPADRERVKDEINLTIQVDAHPAGAPPVYIDLYVDGLFHSQITRPFPATGNAIWAAVGTNLFKYTIAPTEGLFEAVAGLAWAINATPPRYITASAKSDRLEVIATPGVDDDHQPLAFSVGTTKGFGEALRIGGKAMTPHLVPVDGPAAAKSTARGAALFHMGVARSYEIEYPLSIAQLSRGTHTLTLVVRDGTAVEAQSHTSISIQVAK